VDEQDVEDAQRRGCHADGGRDGGWQFHHSPATEPGAKCDAQDRPGGAADKPSDVYALSRGKFQPTAKAHGPGDGY